MTLTQLGAFILVARLGSVRAAADALGVREPAVSQAIGALRADLGDPLLVRGAHGMTLTAGGARLLPIASRMVSLGAEASSVVRAASGAAEELRIVASSAVAEFVLAPLAATFGALVGESVEVTTGVAASEQNPVLLANRLADVALGPRPAGAAGNRLPGLPILDSQPVFRAQLVAATAPGHIPCGSPARWMWLVDESATDATSDTARLLDRLGVGDEHVRVFPNQATAWESAAAGHGVTVATMHLLGGRLRRRELRLVETPITPMTADWYVTSLDADHRTSAASALRQFLTTPRAMQQMRQPGDGVPPSRFRPPVYVTIWH